MKTDAPQRSLYDPQFEHDSCGVGFVANISGQPSRIVLERAVEALTSLIHRGAVDADGKTGDGAGVLTQIPRKLFLKKAEKLGWAELDAEDLAVGMFFLPRQPELLSRCRSIVENVLRNRGLMCLGWRAVPVNNRALGERAAATAPIIEQLLIGRGWVPIDEYEQILYFARKQIENMTSDIEGFYIPSLSCRTIVYKGLFAATQLTSFYLDLKDPQFETALAVLHQRYSTNTFPNWFLAQPFRMLAHNGEINTLASNRNWMRAREAQICSGGRGSEIESLKPIIWAGGSDSASLDNVLELLVRHGRDPLHSMMMLMPEAHEHAPDMDSDLRGFYDYAACLIEPWDGPAAVAFSDGRFVGAALDRNGLRPARYTITSDGLIIMASEVGTVELDPESIVEKGRLGPGKMIAVDTERGLLLTDEKIKLDRAKQKPYAQWVRRSMIVCPRNLHMGSATYSDEATLKVRMKSFGYTLEDLQRILEPMLSEGKEPVGSMGDDTPLAALSAKPRLIYTYFKQRFAQVTNPAIDPIRERMVMSLETLIGPRDSLLEETPAAARLLKLQSPILTDSDLEWLRQSKLRGFPSVTLATLFGKSGGWRRLEHMLEVLCERAAEAIHQGHSILILSDRGVSEFQAPIPMLLAVSAVHHHLIREGLRMKASIIAETGEAREDHHFACLIGYGANAVNPYLAFEAIANEVSRRGMSVPGALRNYKTAVENGLLKIMAKMGIATVASYCGAQIFEAVGLDCDLVEKYFTGTPSRVGGVSLEEIARDVLRFHQAAFPKSDPNKCDTLHKCDTLPRHEIQLEDAGYYRYRSGGEFHSFNPAVFRALHKVASSGDRREYERFKQQVEDRPAVSLRDLLCFRPSTPVPINEVEPAEEILRRFSTSGMSHGALSREAHETIAIAMNRIGAKSNSGEGGEDPARYKPRENGDWPNSRIKQVASARFGVTPEYLISADELEIKISQGSKPGEGGQLPGHKVSAEIAAIRHSVPGVTLISPPPHHDIYSIEDLAQLIYDLKQINPGARVAVKLVSEAGVGTIAAGVAKAYADVIHISGHDGGTGASPLGSIKNAGTPWELGLAETQQVLVLNGLRGRVRLRVDGGMKSGRDVVIAAMLGAEEFGFATSALVALGCVMARQCHLNTCPVGIATQAPHLRKKFAGKPEMIVNFFLALAEEVRQLLASLGFRSLREIIGRSDLLVEKQSLQLPKQAKFDLKPMLAQPDPTKPRQCIRERNHHKKCYTLFGASMNDRILQDASRAIATGKPVRLSYEIKNTDRAVGARLAGEIARRYGNKGLPEGTIDITFRGSAGQSFGAFNIAGMRLTLIGEANDYVGKGMGGGQIIIRPHDRVQYDWSENVIIGNTVMYGATGGSLFAAGRAGERFAVRNSGACAVVEGVGDHGCEYMTAGTIVVLGEVGRNFAAGMTGGTAFVLDVKGNFQRNCNHELVKLEPVASEHDLHTLRKLIEQHYGLTGSLRARQVLWHWNEFLPLFWKVITQGEEKARAQQEPETARISHVAAIRDDEDHELIAAAE
jgi:glutamate synthase domain-containing protein 2/glutamate synthase domain-containing protein 1/glutamate synthase domain-containing protein 3